MRFRPTVNAWRTLRARSPRHCWPMQNDSSTSRQRSFRPTSSPQSCLNEQHRRWSGCSQLRAAQHVSNREIGGHVAGWDDHQSVGPRCEYAGRLAGHLKVVDIASHPLLVGRDLLRLFVSADTIGTIG
jgi:hypothetical protein